jgi:hypothetical protein
LQHHVLAGAIAEYHVPDGPQGPYPTKYRVTVAGSSAVLILNLRETWALVVGMAAASQGRRLRDGLEVEWRVVESPENFLAYHMGPGTASCPWCGRLRRDAPWIGKGAQELVHADACPYIGWLNASDPMAEGDVEHNEVRA